MVSGGSLLNMRFVGQRSRSQLLKWEQKIDLFFVSAQYLKYKKLSTHMHHAERNKSHELEVCGSKVKSFRSDISFLRYRAEAKKVSNCCSIFRRCDLDLCPTNLNINRLPPLTIRHVCTKFHLDPTFRSYKLLFYFLTKCRI
jgi:hypothetical protein